MPEAQDRLFNSVMDALVQRGAVDPLKEDVGIGRKALNAWETEDFRDIGKGDRIKWESTLFGDRVCHASRVIPDLRRPGTNLDSCSFLPRPRGFVMNLCNSMSCFITRSCPSSWY